MIPLCVAQETYTLNGSHQYALKFDGMQPTTYIATYLPACLVLNVKLTDKNYQCEDGHALVTDNNWVLSCPPNEEITSRSPSVLNRIPPLSPSTSISKYCKGVRYIHIHSIYDDILECI